jgi:hypothetical protein
MPKRIFISYRRADGEAQAITDHLRDRLLQIFGQDAVFKDVFSIPGAVDFRGALQSAIAETGIMLVIVGKNWVNASNERGRRLDDPADPVRQEIESGLMRGLPILPLLIDGAPMPTENALPPSLGLLAYRNALPLRTGRDFDRDLADIGRTIATYVPPASPLSLQQLVGSSAGFGSKRLVALVVVLALLLGGGFFGYTTFFTNPTLAANPLTLNFPCFGSGTGSSGSTTIVSLDNSANGDDLQWSVSSISQAGGKDWASVSPSSGTVPAHGTEKITVTPDAQLCQSTVLQTLLVTITYHKSISVVSSQLELGTVAVGGGGFPSGGFPTATVP